MNLNIHMKNPVLEIKNGMRCLSFYDPFYGEWYVF
jgi:hypothetical protein